MKYLNKYFQMYFFPRLVVRAVLPLSILKVLKMLNWLRSSVQD